LSFDNTTLSGAAVFVAGSAKSEISYADMDVKGTVTRTGGLDEVGNPFPPNNGSILDGRGGGNLDIRIAANSTYVMDTALDIAGDSAVIVTGHHGSSLILGNSLDSQVFIEGGGSAAFDTKVEGDGYLIVGAATVHGALQLGQMTFGNSVSADMNVYIGASRFFGDAKSPGALVTLNDPKQFAAQNYMGLGGQIRINDAQETSWHFTDGILTIKDFGHTVASLHIKLESQTAENPADLTLSVRNLAHQVVVTVIPVSPVIMLHT
jgi:hypothetical protein